MSTAYKNELSAIVLYDDKIVNNEEEDEEY